MLIFLNEVLSSLEYIVRNVISLLLIGLAMMIVLTVFVLAATFTYLTKLIYLLRRRNIERTD